MSVSIKLQFKDCKKTYRIETKRGVVPTHDLKEPVWIFDVSRPNDKDLCFRVMVALDKTKKPEMGIEPITRDFGLFNESSICHCKGIECVALVICDIWSMAARET